MSRNTKVNYISIFVEFAGICDTEIYHYHFILNEVITARRLMRLPSNTKNGVKFRFPIYTCFILLILLLSHLQLFFFFQLFVFIYLLFILSFFYFRSGTEVSLSTSESIDDLMGEIICFFRKVCWLSYA